MKPGSFSSIVLAFPLLFVCLVIGCGGDDGPELAEVAGKVTTPDGPLKGGEIIFEPAEQGVRAASGVISEDGTYTLTYSPGKTGARPGTYTVKIFAAAEDERGGSKLPKPIHTEENVKIDSGSNEKNFEVKASAS